MTSRVWLLTQYIMYKYEIYGGKTRIFTLITRSEHNQQSRTLNTMYHVKIRNIWGNFQPPWSPGQHGQQSRTLNTIYHVKIWNIWGNFQPPWSPGQHDQQSRTINTISWKNTEYMREITSTLITRSAWPAEYDSSCKITGYMGEKTSLLEMVKWRNIVSVSGCL